MAVSPLAGAPAATTVTRRKRKRGADRREEILGAARKLFAKKGYDGTSIEDIGRAVRMTGPGLYRHFKGKDEIFIETMQRGGAAAEEAMARAVGRPAAEALELILEGEAIVAVNHSECMLIWQRERNRMPARYRKVLRDRRERLYATLDEVLGELRPDLDEATRGELRTVLTSIALGAPDQQSGLSDELRIGFMVRCGMAMVEHAT